MIELYKFLVTKGENLSSIETFQNEFINKGGLAFHSQGKLGIKTTIVAQEEKKYLDQFQTEINDIKELLLNLNPQVDLPNSSKDITKLENIEDQYFLEYDHLSKKLARVEANQLALAKKAEEPKPWDQNKDWKEVLAENKKG